MTRSSTTFQEAYPLSFRLEDQDEVPAIYIVSEDDVPRQTLQLKIGNQSQQPIYLAGVAATGLFDAPGGEADAGSGPPVAEATWRQHAHFELRFRQGTLSLASLGADARPELASQPDIHPSPAERNKPPQAGTWQLSPPFPQPPGRPWVSIYLLRLGPTWALPAGDTVFLVLKSLTAARGQGARDTRVELVPIQENVYTLQAGPSPEDRERVPIEQVRAQVLKVINHQGSPHIPLHAGFIGPNTLLNDNQPHEGYRLQLRITNTSPKKTIHFDESSKLVLHFFSSADQEDTEGAIGTTDNVSGIRFLRENDPIPIEPDPDDISDPEVYWTIGLPADKTQLGPRDYLTLYVDLDQFQTQHPQGITYLTIRYENIPGYWDGELLCPIEIRPLLIQVKQLKGKDEYVKFDSGQRPLQINAKADEALVLSSDNETYATLNIDNHSGKNAIRIGKGNIQMDSGHIEINGDGSAYYLRLKKDDELIATLGIPPESDSESLEIKTLGKYDGLSKRAAFDESGLDVVGEIKIDGRKLITQLVFDRNNLIEFISNSKGDTGHITGLSSNEWDCIGFPMGVGGDELLDGQNRSQSVYFNLSGTIYSYQLIRDVPNWSIIFSKTVNQGHSGLEMSYLTFTFIKRGVIDTQVIELQPTPKADDDYN